uniref:Uncharacterized protein n=1 Tax=Loxodonta africana TaxID=9785 RepID=G3STM1_LOXAF
IRTRKHWHSNDYLHLSPVNFAIQTGKGGKYAVSGKLTHEYLQQLSEKFYCSCYAGFNCERNDIQTIHDIDVCMGEDICIDIFLNAEPGEYPSSGEEEPSLAFTNIPSTTTLATELHNNTYVLEVLYLTCESKPVV